MNKIFYYIIGVLLVFYGVNAFGEVYSYTDSSGKKHYVSNTKEVPLKYQNQIRKPTDLPKINRTPKTNYSNNHRRSAKLQQKPVLLVMQGCGYCVATEKLLEQHKVSYQKYDINKDVKGKILYNQLGRGGVPIMKVGSNIIQGFDPSQILRAIGK